MSSEEAPGTSSSYYSTSSNSSSAENICSSGASTIENGDLSVFTFMISRSLTPDLSHLPEEPGSCVHMASCHCSCRTNKFSRTDSRNSLSIDPFGVSPHHVICRSNQEHRKYRKMCQSPFNDAFSRMLSQSTLDGLLLRSMEKGVLFPVIHWSSKTNENLTQDSHLSGSSVVLNQGVYKELKRVIPDAWIHKSPEDSTEKTLSKKPTWLVIGYKSLEKTLDSTLEATWKEWTGSRHIYLNLRNDFEIQRISFFHRVHPQDNLDLFMYVVLMEIGNVDEGNIMWLLDFVQRTRVERMKGFLTVYGEVENEFSTINDEYMKYFTSEVSNSTSSESLPEVGNNITGKKFIEKLLQEIHETPLVDYF